LLRSAARFATSAMRVVSFLALFACGPSAALELTEETWDDAVMGKAVFVKFLAPW